MLIKAMLEREHLDSGLAPLSAVTPLMANSAANDAADQSNAMARRQRRQRRQAKAMSSGLGGWTVRMW